MDQVYQKKGDTTHNQNMLVERQYHTPNQLPYSPHRTYQENEQQKEKEMVFYSREKNLIEPLSSGIQACIPFSPPHQYYDPYLARSSGTATDFSKQAYYHHQHAQNSFLSPPSQSTSLQKQEQYRRSSDPFKRIVGDTRYMGVGNSQRRMSLQSYHQPQYSSYPPDSGPVHLPPLRSVVPSATLEILPPIPKHKQTGEVDAAVAMIQLASLRKPRKTASLSLW
ncbi:hypothetical protein BY458DRAFT_288670 [Sporodiniella umbellata]|nr:hypothetical protein BY458DRAFT_288670 [Sporodiniella umbellata]